MTIIHILVSMPQTSLRESLTQASEIVNLIWIAVESNISAEIPETIGAVNAKLRRLVRMTHQII